MMRRLTEDIGWKLLALAIAGLLWIIVNREPALSAAAPASLELKNRPDGMEIVAGVPSSILVSVRGPSGHLSRSELSQLSVVLDCSVIHEPGAHTFNIGRGDVRLPFGVTFDSAMPSQVQLSFDRTVTRKVRVVPHYAGAPPPGYAIERYQIEPAMVRITGPESHVEHIDAIETDPIDLSGIVSQAELHLPAHVGDPRVRLDSSAPLLTYKVVLQKIPSKADPR